MSQIDREWVAAATRLRQVAVARGLVLVQNVALYLAMTAFGGGLAVRYFANELLYGRELCGTSILTKHMPSSCHGQLIIAVNNHMRGYAIAAMGLMGIGLSIWLFRHREVIG